MEEDNEASRVDPLVGERVGSVCRVAATLPFFRIAVGAIVESPSRLRRRRVACVRQREDRPAAWRQAARRGRGAHPRNDVDAQFWREVHDDAVETPLGWQLAHGARAVVAVAGESLPDLPAIFALERPDAGAEAVSSVCKAHETPMSAGKGPDPWARDDWLPRMGMSACCRSDATGRCAYSVGSGRDPMSPCAGRQAAAPHLSTLQVNAWRKPQGAYSIPAAIRSKASPISSGSVRAPLQSAQASIAIRIVPTVAPARKRARRGEPPSAE